MKNLILKKISNFFIIYVLLFVFLIPFKAKAAIEELKTLEKGVLTVGTNATYKPFEYVDDKKDPAGGNVGGDSGKIVGIDIDLINLIGKKMGYKVNIVDMKFESLLPALGSKIDIAIAALSDTPERRKAVLFSDSYFCGRQNILTLPDKEITDIHSFNHCKVGTQIGTTANEQTKEKLKGVKGVEFADYDAYDIMIEDLKMKRIDAVVLGETTANAQVKKHGNAIKLTKGSVLNFPEENCCIATAKTNEELMKRINSTLNEIKKSKEMDAIIEKYMGDSINEKQPAQENKNVAEKDKSTAKEKQGFFGRINEQFYTACIEKKRYLLYLKGLGITLVVTIFAAILGIFLGIIFALMKLSKNKYGKKTIIARFAGLYISIIRGTPILVQLLIMWLVVLKNAKNGIFVASVSFGLNSAAYVAEIIRGGVNAVDSGQTQASLAMGFSKIQTMLYVVLPQGIKNSIPALCNEFISLLKETSVVGYVALTDLTRAAFSISAASYQTFMPLALTAIIYFAVTKIISLILEAIERRLCK